ncbi:MAG: VWA domain-containing protein, partial [Elusimicrobiota bacterium]|nr:VWA domain-containing protein [Elusimicrobiota bacterium]
MTKKVFSKYFIYCVAGIIAALILGGLGWLLLRKYSFANPTLLWLAFPVAILCIIAALLKHIFKPSLKFPLPAVLKEDNQKKEKNIFAFLANWTAFSLCALALFLCAVALARPRSEGKTIIPPTKGIDIMLTIDISQSMLALDFQPDRITAAKTTAEDFVKKRATDRIGVVVFDDLSMLQCPLTLDYFAVFDYIKTINIGITGGKGGTAIGDAVALSVEHLKNSAARSKVLILLTDGENNSGTVDPVAAAKA